MAVRELSAMTWEEVDALDAACIVAILPVGATEAHGPHLPLGTDVVIAEAMATSGGGRLSDRGLEALILPAIAYTPVPFAAGFAGTIGISADTLTTTIASIAAALGARGIRTLAIANAHLDPAHVRALYNAVAVAASLPSDAPCATIIYPDITRRELASQLTDEFRSGACHAGRYETSIVLATRPELVREPLRAALVPVPESLTEAMRAGKSTFEEAGGGRAYFGAPAEATEAEGHATIAALGAILERAVMQSLEPS
jgi:creatinine amidohydrolase